MQMSSAFSRFARHVAYVIGSPATFVVAVLGVAAWGMAGPFFGYSSSWQLLINTCTTIITFLLVVLLQHSQNHDARALHLKLDELIRSVRPARNQLVNLEQLSDAELDELQAEFEAIRSKASRGKTA
jgi:low affinity Fe/Cu permease